MESPAPDYGSPHVKTPQGERLVHTAIAMIVIQIVFVILRGWSRLRQNTGWMVSDILVPISLLVNISVCVMAICSVQYAAAALQPDKIAELHPDVLPLYFKMFYYAIFLLYAWAVVLPKLAVLDIYLHVFIDKVSRWSCYVIGGLLIIYAIVLTPIGFLLCQPLSQLWNPVPGGHCYDLGAVFLYVGVPNAITDLVILILPIPVVLKLQTSKKTKVGLCFVFLTGALGVIVSVLRIVSYTDLDVTADKQDGATDVTFLVCECSIYLVACCLLSLRPLLIYVAYQSPIASIISRSANSRKGSSTAEHHQISLRQKRSKDHHSEDQDSILQLAPGLGRVHNESFALSVVPLDKREELAPGIHVEREVEISRSDAIV